MIVTIHPRVSNIYPTVDTDLRIQVHRCTHRYAPGERLLLSIKVKGSQLIAAGVNYSRSMGLAIHKDSYYYMSCKDVVPVCYDCITFKPAVLEFQPDTDLTAVLRVQKYDNDGDPMLLVSEMIRATSSLEVLAFVDPHERHLVSIRRSVVTIHQQK